MWKWIDEASARVSAWNDQRRQMRLLRSDPPGVTVPAWLVGATKFAAWVATCSLIYFLWLYTLDIARDRAAALHVTHAGAWVGDLQFWFPYIIGFAVVAFGIPYVAKIAIPTFVSLTWRGDPTAKAWSLGIAVAVSLVVVAGTFAVQGNNLMERDRDAAVAVEHVQQEAAVLTARIADVQHAMDERTRSPSPYVRAAASMSPAAYDAFLASRRDDPRYQMLASYRAVSQEMVSLNQQMSTLREQQARQQVTASVQREVVTPHTSWIADTLGWLEGVRAILLSFVMDIVALIMPLIALRLEQARNRQMGMAEGMPRHRWMLEDKKAERLTPDQVDRRNAQDVVDAMIAGGADPRFAADMARSALRESNKKEEMYDAETGEKLHFRKSTWVKPPKRKGRSATDKDAAGEMLIAPEAASLPDERGADPALDGGDGGLRSAGSRDASGGHEEANRDNEQSNKDAEVVAGGIAMQHEEPPEVVELDEDALAADRIHDETERYEDGEHKPIASEVAIEEPGNEPGDSMHSIPPQEPQQVADVAEQGGDEHEPGEVEQKQEADNHYDAHVKARALIAAE